VDGNGPKQNAVAYGGWLVFDLELNFMRIEGFEEGMWMRRKSSRIRGGGGGIRRGRSGRGVGIDAMACRGTTMVLLLLLT